MQDFELEYAALIDEVLRTGVKKRARNGETTSLFGMSLTVDNIAEVFPLIQGRKMFPNGVFGEWAAMIRGPKHIDDFKKFGCNFWEKWCNEGGSIDVDYGNAWLDFDGVNQIEELRNTLMHNPNDRRMIVTGWRPNRLQHLNLPCCHYNYQFHVADGELNMIWTQRSVDMMIGLPSDIILAAVWLITLANDVGLKPGRVKMDFGDCHVYAEHYLQAAEYVKRVQTNELQPVTYELMVGPGMHMCLFEPTDIALGNYEHLSKMALELKE